MPGSGQAVVLALNSGSSSLKFGVFTEKPGDVQAICRGSIQGIGTNGPTLQMQRIGAPTVPPQPCACATHAEAIRTLVEFISRLEIPQPIAIGHRLVHGGPSLREHQVITPGVLRTLEAVEDLAPLHVPLALTLIRQTESHYPRVPQFACFDTAFHRTLPEAASRFPLPAKFWSDGIRRYGFHGLSCESAVHSLQSDIPARIIIAHLGNGASITAVADGRSVDTSMGLTPTGGIIMGTRSGDLDPSVLLYLVRSTGSGVNRLEHLLDKNSGLLGISGISSDMRELHKASADRNAQLAVEMFCRTAKKTIGGFAALMGGVDLLIFTGGIGEHDAVVRGSICAGLEFLGVALDASENAQNSSLISAPSSHAKIRVLTSDEEAQIARHVFRLVSAEASPMREHDG